jgi:hypothetical protein
VWWLVARSKSLPIQRMAYQRMTRKLFQKSTAKYLVRVLTADASFDEVLVQNRGTCTGQHDADDVLIVASEQEWRVSLQKIPQWILGNDPHRR